MTKLGLLFGFVSLLSLVGCNDKDYPQTEVNKEGRFTDALRCQNSRGNGCDMDWVISSSSNGFPSNIELVVNDKILYSECKDRGNMVVTRGSAKVEVKLWNYEALKDEAQKFSLQVTNLGNCFEDKKVYYRHAEQKYDLKEINGKKMVIIDI